MKSTVNGIVKIRERICESIVKSTMEKEYKEEENKSDKKKWRVTYICCFTLRIPAIPRVMSHLVSHVLTETKLLFLHTNFSQEEEDTSHEVTQCLIGY